MSLLVIMNGGYNYRVCSHRSRLICKVCHFPSQNPCLSVCCGHMHCLFKSCTDAAHNVIKDCLVLLGYLASYLPVVQNKVIRKLTVFVFYVLTRRKAVNGRVN